MTYFVLLFERNLSKCLVITIGLKNWVPSEHIFASRLHDLAITFANKDQWFGTRPLTECKYALSVGCLVIESLDHIPEALSANRSQEILSKENFRLRMLPLTYRVLVNHSWR